MNKKQITNSDLSNFNNTQKCITLPLMAFNKTKRRETNSPQAFIFIYTILLSLFLHLVAAAFKKNTGTFHLTLGWSHNGLPAYRVRALSVRWQSGQGDKSFADRAWGRRGEQQRNCSTGTKRFKRSPESESVCPVHTAKVTEQHTGGEEVTLWPGKN